MAKVWFITGSSRGLGRSLTAAVLAHGDQVVATARHPQQLQAFTDQYPSQVLALPLDVTDNAQVQSAVAQAIAHFGRIDVLVNNAGFGIIGASEAFTEEQVQSQLATNLYAPINITRAVLPHMRRQRAGRILQISSIGGRVGGPGLTIYQAAKFGLGGYTEALRNEIAPLGIFVTSVEPGGFRTNWHGDSMSYAPAVEGYENTVGLVKETFSSGDFVPMGDPDKAAKVMIDLVDHPEPPTHLILGSEAVGMLRRAEDRKMADLEKWLPVSNSTDHDDAVSFFDSAAGKRLMAMREK
ncbi:SDR family NAD(P)-dependent oxidoreductase [Chitinophaga vietnamensis]|uniref:SDR family NAD(P)-dependent oxidoreductase n=1 Tax=Chitinophaga vietnamensis TaxID=2593957 RepID=UPI0011778E63|nr:SDR family NAD(P)-dependent oxidoreductase [Chitinophaga vietnamensis]